MPDGGAHGQKSAPLASGEWMAPTSAAALATAKRSPASTNR